MMFFPWDMDFAFDRPATSDLIANNDLWKLLSDPNNAHAFYGHVHDLISATFNNADLDRWIDHYGERVTDPFPQTFKDFIANRVARVTEECGNSNCLPEEVEFAVNDAVAFIRDESIVAEINGTGWINVREIRLGGSEHSIGIEWTNETNWKVTIPIDRPTQEFTFVAYDFQGNRIGADSIIVQNSFGDIDRNGSITADDIDALCRGIRNGDAEMDFSNDGELNVSDLLVFVRSILNLSIGDSNFDGRFDSADLVRVFQSNEFEDGLPENSTWAEGDWNCDSEFNTRDLVFAFQFGEFDSF